MPPLKPGRGLLPSLPRRRKKNLDRGARVITWWGSHFLLMRGLQIAARKFAELEIRARTAGLVGGESYGEDRWR
jgi:hypothetical protein